MRRIFCVGLVVLLGAPWARAQSGGESADELFVRARGLMKTGDCAGALPLLERSHGLEPTLGTRLNMAMCEARLGKLTQARAHLTEVIEASAPGDDRRGHAERALRELVPRIPFVVVEIDTARHELEVVRLDGEVLLGMKPNEPYPINPGAHELEVVLVREAPQVRRFTVAERQLYTWSLGGLSAVTTTAATKAPKSTPRVSSDAPAPDFWTTRRTAAIVAGSASLTSFGLAVGFTLSARSIYDSSDAHCDADDRCDPTGIERRDRARMHGRIATMAATVGVAAAAGAAVLWFTGTPEAPRSSRSSRVGLRGNAFGHARSGSVVFEGSF
jgi:hypothetical protein